ncbi:hypothetical protein IU433_26325 [Nocardia puris]|uniref:hypothetical protein n=1 Tax=Nocardia puris TaxID=208602 RepID=UPI0018943999|nr:hypothetical protein [Nocardia puris]MBF6462531.1 hypothetical protein [Nocardia puris]
MPNKRLVKVTAYLMVGVVYALLLVYDIDLPDLVVRSAFTLPFVAIGVYWLYDTRAWRWPPIDRFAGKPWLGGTWVGTLTERRSSAGVEVGETRDLVVAVEQSSSRVRVVMMIETIRAVSRSSSLTIDSDRVGELDFRYDYRPVSGEAADQWQRGAAVVEIHGRKPKELSGLLWTDTGVCATFTVALVSRTRVETFSQGIMMSQQKIEEIKALRPVSPQPIGSRTRSR